MRIYLKALGCRLNEAELESWAQGFIEAGHQISNIPDKADIIIINTCAVTEEAARKSRRLIGQVHQKNPLAKLVVSGCYVSLKPNQQQILSGIDLIITNEQKNQLVPLTLKQLSPYEMPAICVEESTSALFARGRNRAFVKIQQGCRYRCTFCIVTLARGKEKSRHIADIISDLRRIYAQGIYEIVLTGVHAGGYGYDIGSSLVELIQAILQDTDIPRIRLGSLEPWDLPIDFFDLFENPRMMPHLHLPLQSGDDYILRRMARRCKVTDFSALVELARAKIDNLQISTDIIVGFPGETDKSWQRSLSYITKTHFSDIHIFTYSKRIGTAAANFPDQIPSEIKRQRSAELHGLANKMRQAILVEQMGKTYPVLWEGEIGKPKSVFSGYTPNYIRVQCEFSSPKVLANQIQPTLIKGFSDIAKGGLIGIPAYQDDPIALDTISSLA